MEKTRIRKQRTDSIDDFSEAELRNYRMTTRRFAAWNRRAVLLRALEANPSEEERAFIETTVENLENAFRDAAWEAAGDAAAGLDPVTPVPTKAEIEKLAKANYAAAQKVAEVSMARDMMLLGTRFLAIANGAIPT